MRSTLLEGSATCAHRVSQPVATGSIVRQIAAHEPSSRFAKVTVGGHAPLMR